jgi:hypothetical protein
MTEHPRIALDPKVLAGMRCVRGRYSRAQLEMWFLANENLARTAIDALQVVGHDIVRERTAAQEATIATVLTWAAGEERVLLTSDKDFGQLAGASILLRTCGVVLFKSRCRLQAR